MTLSSILTLNLLILLLALQFVRRYALNLFILSLALTCGVYAYLYESVQPYSVWNSLYSTLRLFLLDLDNTFAEADSPFTEYPLSIQIARFAAASYTAMTIVLLLYQRFGQNMKLFLYRVLGNHVVLSGSNPIVVTLAEQLRLERKRIVLLADGILQETASSLEKMGIVVLSGGRADPKLYKKSGLYKARHFAAFHDDDAHNLDELLSVRDYLLKINPIRTSRVLQIVIRLTHPASELMAETMERSILKSTHDKLMIRIFNMHRTIAEHVFNEHPLYRGYEERVADPLKDPLHLLIVGFGQTGQEIARQAIQRAHFFNQKPLRITVLDQEARKLEREWLLQYPTSPRLADLTFCSMDLRLDSLESHIEEASFSYTHVYICLSSDYDDLMHGIRLSGKLGQVPIFIKLKEDYSISSWVHGNEDELHNVFRFGWLKQVLNGAHVLDELMDEGARKAHEWYRKAKRDELRDRAKKVSHEIPPDNLPKWAQLPLLKRESNRALMHHSTAKLALLGIKHWPKRQPVPAGYNLLSEDGFEKMIRPKLERMAEIEHQRWNTFHLLRGWKTWTAPLTESKKTQDEQNRLHRCLVPWSQLDELKERLNEDFKQYDRQTIQDLFALWNELGYDLLVPEAAGEP